MRASRGGRTASAVVPTCPNKAVQRFCAGFSALLAPAQAATFFLADDFSSADNGTNRIWSYRLDDFSSGRPQFPLLTSTRRDAKALWGSTFSTPPQMWCEAGG